MDTQQPNIILITSKTLSYTIKYENTIEGIWDMYTSSGDYYGSILTQDSMNTLIKVAHDRGDKIEYLYNPINKHTNYKKDE